MGRSKRKRCGLLAAIGGAALCGTALLAPVPAAAWPDEARVTEILRARVDTMKQSRGIVAGMVDAAGTRIVGYGVTEAGGGPVDGRTRFEVGSISKAFASVLLADMVRKGEVSLRDPVRAHLPDSVRVPVRDGRSIRLIDLVTHRSSLPRMPDDLPAVRAGAYEAYGEGRMLAFVSRVVLPRDVGTRYEYSNLGFGLLGIALGHRAGMDFEALLRERLCGPLGLEATGVRVEAKGEARLARGHDWTLAPAPAWPMGALSAAGGVRTTAEDLLVFLEANLGLRESPLYGAMQMTHLEREDTIFPRLKMGLGWHVIRRHGREIVWHSGATFGYVAFAAFDKDARRGVVVLSNARGMIDDIGLHLLDERFELAEWEPTSPAEPVEVAAEELEAYVGEYEVVPGAVLSVSLQDGRLFVSQNEGLKTEAVPVSKTSFQLKLAPVKMTFRREDGEIAGVRLEQFNVEHEAKRLEAYEPPPKRAAGPPARALLRLAGTYRGEEGPPLHVRATEDGLTVQGEGQLAMRLLPVEGGGFWAEAAEARFRFEGDGGLIVEQEGASYALERVAAER